MNNFIIEQINTNMESTLIIYNKPNSETICSYILGTEEWTLVHAHYLSLSYFVNNV